MGTRRSARVLRHEAQIARDVIALVESGASRRVVIAGLRFADDVAGMVRESALAAGLRIRSLSRPSGAGVDLAIEAIRE